MNGHRAPEEPILGIGGLIVRDDDTRSQTLIGNGLLYTGMPGDPGGVRFAAPASADEGAGSIADVLSDHVPDHTSCLKAYIDDADFGAYVSPEVHELVVLRRCFLIRTCAVELIRRNYFPFGDGAPAEPGGAEEVGLRLSTFFVPPRREAETHDSVLMEVVSDMTNYATILGHEFRFSGDLIQFETDALVF